MLPSWSDVEKTARVLELSPAEKELLHMFYEAEWKREQQWATVRLLTKFAGCCILAAMIFYAFGFVKSALRLLP